MIGALSPATYIDHESLEMHSHNFSFFKAFTLTSQMDSFETFGEAVVNIAITKQFRQHAAPIGGLKMEQSPGPASGCQQKMAFKKWKCLGRRIMQMQPAEESPVQCQSCDFARFPERPSYTSSTPFGNSRFICMQP